MIKQLVIFTKTKKFNFHINNISEKFMIKISDNRSFIPDLFISHLSKILLFTFFIQLTYQLSPSFLTNLNDCKTGTAVLTVSSSTTSNGFDTTTSSITFSSAFTQTPNVALGLGYLASTFTTTTSLNVWIIDFSASSSTSTSFTVVFNRTSAIVSQISLNYIAVLSTSFLQITYSKFDLSLTNLFTQSSSTRSISRNITYRSKSNSTNAVIAINVVGMHVRRQSNSFSYTVSISGQYSTLYEVTTTVPTNNQLGFISIYGISYQSVATTISPPMYLSIGYVSDFSGTIPENSGATGVSLSNMGTIYTAMVQWMISDSNGVNNYNFSLSGNTYQIVSISLITCRNSYVWYRQQVCPDYYYLLSHNCIACDITCNSCSGPSSTDCLTCTSTRTYISSNKSCVCITGYVEQGSRDCVQVTCNVDLCKTCSYINQCGSCYTFLFRELSGTSCVCMAYRYDHYSLDGSPYCDACHYSCLTCTTSGANSCSSCNQTRDHRQFKSSNSTCTCITGYYDASTTICSKCQYTCASCVTGGYCLSCNSTKGRQFDNTSTFCSCSAGLYDNLLQEQCLTCIYSCSTCNNGLSCSSCPATRYLTNSSTSNNLCECIPGYFDNYVSSTCLNCQYTCYTCINTAQCDSCSSAMYREYNNITKFCTCTTGYYDDGSNQLCANCYLMCLGCIGPNSTACTSCDAAKYRTLASTGMCVCMNGYYQVNTFTSVCSKCYYTCATCVNGIQCTSCNSAKFRTPSATNSSVCVCSNGYYDTGNQICTLCPYYCLTCSNSTSCLTCDSNTRNILQNCICIDGFYDDGVNNACQPCLSQCLTCNNPFNCTSCTPVIKYLASTARCKCSAGYLQPSCTPCSYQCQQCSISADNCVQCNGLFYRYYSYNNVSAKGECTCYQGYYSDNVNGLCKSCQYSCQSCIDSTSCVSCPSTRQFDQLNQYCTCVSQYYQNSVSLNCLQCHYSCSNCSDYAVCTSCNSAKFRIYDSTAATTLCLCTPGYYDNGISQLCYACASQCQTCSSYLYCLSCDLSTKFRILNNNTHRCPCTQGYYQSTTDFLCYACHYSCMTCLDGSVCLSCVTGRVLDSSGLCRCSDCTYQNITTKQCLLCTYPCNTCNSNPSTCTTCQSTHLLLASTSTCYCQVGKFQNSTQCDSCLQFCLSCTQKTSCSSCRPSDNRNLVLVNTVNLCNCINGYHDQNGTIISCIQCHYSCTTCSNSISCSACSDIRIFRTPVLGYCSCPDRFYDDGSNAVCLPCNVVCLTCSSTSTNCLTCSASAYRELYAFPAINTSTCVCKAGYFSQANTQTCGACHYSCATCTSSLACVTCNSTFNRVLQPSTTSYCACNIQYYDITNVQQCQKCSYTCLTCSQTSSNCLSCPSTRYLLSSSCPCTSGLFDDMISNNSTCSSCLYMCETCDSSYSCLTCPSTRFLNSSNLCACLSGYYDTLTNKLCQACHPTCQQCSDYQVCTLCYDTTQLRILVNGACICQEGYYDQTVSSLGSTNYTCQSCHYSCQRCQNSLSCSSCNSLMFRIRDVSTGLCKCIDGYYDDNSNQMCLSCSFDCLTCSDGTSCLTCPTQRSLDTTNTPHRCLCSSAYYTNGTQCQLCPPQCATCTSYSACITCNNPTQRSLVLGACVCNTKLFPVSNSALCQSCHYSCASCTSYPFCETCSSTSHRFLSAKQCRCLTSYYDDLINQVCKGCHYSCLTCSNSSQCLTCDTSSVSNRIFNSTNKLCPCNIGFYEDSTLKICLQCSYTCYTCTNSNTCQSCTSTSLRVLNTTSSQCQCPIIGYYDKALTLTCVSCDPTCYKCSSNSTYCTDCNTAITFRLLTSTHTCLCNDGYFQSTSQTVICSSCSYKCLTCVLQSTQCTSCSTSNNRDNTTIPSCSCLQGYFDDGSSPQCQLCDFRCSTCLDGFKCVTCDLPTSHRVMNLVSQMCDCDNRFYQPFNSSITRDSVCLPCQSSCLTCNHGTLCLTCDLTNNTRYFDNGQCLCNQGYYDDGSNILCLACNYRCQTCISSSSCATCDYLKNRFYNASSLFCDCLRAYYDVADGIDSQCYACHQSCYTCTNSTACQTCPALTNKYINSTEGTSYCICLYGYYQVMSTGVCAQCHYSCQKCSGSSTSCTTCDARAFRTLSNGACPCMSGYFDDTRNELCLTCIANCTRCFGSNAGQCLQCINGTYLLNGICYSSCPSYYYPINSTWVCDSCSSYCTTCPDNTNCNICQSGFYLIQSNLSNLANHMVCTNPCPQFYYHNTTNCLKCISPCLHCSGLYVCTDCIASYFLDNSTNSCYPCHATCRYCLNGGALGCISCIDGYYLNNSINLCQKLTCAYNQYVNSLYGCYSCQDTYPNSLECNANTITKCANGYILTTNNLTSVKQCLRCNLVPGYQLISSTGLCEEICGDGIKMTDSCDDGNTLNGDGCSSICSIQSSWQCTASSPSTCTISANFQPSIVAQSISKLPKTNKISVVLVLNIGLRLIKQNFKLQFKKVKQFQYSAEVLNSKYTRYILYIQYFESIAKESLKISIVSPIQANSNSRNLQYVWFNSRMLQSSLALSISLSLQLSLQILTQPPAVYYSDQIRQNYTTILYIFVILIHVFSLFTFMYFIFLIRVKVMLYTIQFLNFITLLYLYSTYGLYNVSELASETARGLQHFIYKFGEELPEKYIGTKSSPGYFGFGGFVLAGCLIQVVVLFVCIIIKIIFGGASKAGKQNQSQSLTARLNPIKNAVSNEHLYNIFRYYHLSFLYSFLPELMLCCVVVFKWIQINYSIQSAYSWGIAIIIFVMVFIENTMYISYAYPYARIIEKKINNMKIVNPLPFVSKENEEMGDDTNKINSIGNKIITANFVTIDEAIEQNKTNNKQQEAYTQKDKLQKYENFNDPFAQEEQEINNTYQKCSMGSQKKLNDSISQKSYKNLIKTVVKDNRMNNKRNLNDQQNHTQAVIFDAERQSENSEKNMRKRVSQTRSQRSQNQKSTTVSKILQTSLIPLYDLTPTQTPYAELSNVNMSYNRLILHHSYLPFKCFFLTLIICVISQVQEATPRCSLLILSQIVAIVYMSISMRVRNTRFIKLLFMSVILMGISICGLACKLYIDNSSIDSWTSSGTKDTITNAIYIIQGIFIGLIFVGMLFNLIMYIYQCVSSPQYKQYKIQKRNKQILERNIRKNRLRNLNPLTNQQLNQTQSISGLKNIFSNVGHQTQSFQDMINQRQYNDRNDTKQHLRMDSEMNTPAEYQNTSSNILMDIGQNRRNNVEIIDIEDMQNEPNNLAIHKKLKNALEVSKNKYNTVPTFNNNKKTDQKQLVINSMEEEDESNHHLQSTRINDNQSKLVKGLKNKNAKNGKQGILSFWDRPNNYLSMLENEMIGENSNDTLMIIQQKNKEKSKEHNRDDTLISYKQSQQFQNNDKQNKKANKIVQEKDSKRFSIIKDLIPTREYEDVSNEKQQNEYKKMINDQKIKDLSKISKFNEQEYAQHQMDEQRSEEEGEASQQQNTQKIKYYKYSLKGNKQKNNNLDTDPKHKKGKNIKSEQIDGHENKQKIKRSNTTNNPYNIVRNNQLLQHQQEQYEYEKQINYNQQQKEPKIIKRANTYQSDINMLTLQLPKGLKDDRIDFSQGEKKKIKNKKDKKQSLKREKSPKNHKVRRIDSISSISDHNQQKDYERRKFGSQQESDQSEGITVFKKILQDYQIYKNKKVRGYPLRKKL